MPSAGIRQLASGRWKLYWRLDGGTQGSETYDDKEQAETAYHKLQADWADGTWVDPKLSRTPFSEWADQWWESWSADPTLSPNTLVNTKRRLQLHIRPFFGRMQLRTIRPQHVKRWQHELEGKTGYSTVTACRSILYRILQAAEDDDRIAANPVAKVKAPKKPIDLDVRFGRAKRHTFTPEELGWLLAATPTGYRDHFLVQAGTGLRPAELLGLRVARVDLTRGHLEVLTVRYDAGEFGSGYKDRPKSVSSIRPVPLSPLVTEAVTRRVKAAKDADALVFPGPGGSNRVRRGAGKGLSVHNYQRAFMAALAEASRSEDPTVSLTHLDPDGPHQGLRGTFATWLEDAGIPSRVIDELMGHASGNGEVSRMGALYRETTPTMLARVTAAIDERLTRTQAAAARLLPEMDNRRRARMPRGKPRRKPQAL